MFKNLNILLNRSELHVKNIYFSVKMSGTNYDQSATDSKDVGELCFDNDPSKLKS